MKLFVGDVTTTTIHSLTMFGNLKLFWLFSDRLHCSCLLGGGLNWVNNNT